MKKISLRRFRSTSTNLCVIKVSVPDSPSRYLTIDNKIIDLNEIFLVSRALHVFTERIYLSRGRLFFQNSILEKATNLGVNGFF